MLYKIDWHDWAIYAFARSKKYSWYIDPQSHMFYRQHFANQLGANSGIKQFLKRAKEIACGYAINQTLLIIKFLKFENNHFVKSWINCTRLDFVKLSFFAYECRRRKKDQLLFFLSCIIMAMIRPIKENK
ncbi:MAG TPA: hypothetical protein DD434_10790 [Bacteroidales bacterium]|nr:hypothetical protein [Bacteroidales bacterium]